MMNKDCRFCEPDRNRSKCICASYDDHTYEYASGYYDLYRLYQGPQFVAGSPRKVTTEEPLPNALYFARQHSRKNYRVVARAANEGAALANLFYKYNGMFIKRIVSIDDGGFIFQINDLACKPQIDDFVVAVWEV
jgi:hypothetical protein